MCWSARYTITYVSTSLISTSAKNIEVQTAAGRLAKICNVAVQWRTPPPSPPPPPPPPTDAAVVMHP